MTRRDAGCVRPARVAAIAAATILVLLPQTAQSAKYKAKLLESCCAGETIESGATEPAFFTLLNEGVDVWGGTGQPVVSIATDDPRAPSEFLAANWPSPERAFQADLSPVFPGSSFKFEIDVKGPPVTAPTNMTQHFGLLIGEKDWVDAGAKGEAKEPLGPDLTLPLTVVPQQPPGIEVGATPSKIVAGMPFEVTAVATSDASVNHVTVEYDGHSVTSTVPRSAAIVPDEQTRWSPTETFVAAGSGVQNITATAWDDAGLSASATTTVDVLAAPPAPTVRKFTARFRAATTGRRGHYRLLRVTIEPTVRGELLSVVCHGCQGRSRLGPVLARSTTGTIQAHHTTFTAQSRLFLYVRSRSERGRYDVYRVNPLTRQVPLLSEGCTVIDSTAHVGC
jgi:hypothetical protein